MLQQLKLVQCQKANVSLQLQDLEAPTLLGHLKGGKFFRNQVVKKLIHRMIYVIYSSCSFAFILLYKKMRSQENYFLKIQVEF